jgi:hypothetical protein
MAMIGICAFHWPITLYLMVRPDSPRDIDEDVRLIVDETIARQGLTGRIVNGAQSDVSKLERYPDGTKKAGRIKTSCCLCCASFKLSEVEQVRTLHMKPGISGDTDREGNYVNGSGEKDREKNFVDGYLEGSEAHDEYKKLFKAERMGDAQKQKLKAKGRVPEDMPSMNRIQLRRYAFQNNVPQVDIDDIDAKGIMKDLDTPEGGVSGPRKRPREKAFEFGMEVAIVVVATLFSGESELRYGEIGNHCADSERAPDAVGIDLWNERACQRARTEDECNTQPPSFNCAWEPRPLNMVELRLGLLFIMHLLQALYFVNPLALLCGEVCCSPYRDKGQTDSRSGIMSLGYPYNWEPLNYIRAAGCMICASLAAYEVLSFRKYFDDQAKAQQNWLLCAGGCIVFYLLMMMIRWCVFCRDKGRVEKEKEEQRP